ncbi:MAG: immunoglobulin domain-containing protein, partial [Bacteroidota bacterium]
MNLNKFALFILLSVFATKGYSQCSIVGNSQVCTNVAAVFTTDCPVPEGNAWYVNNQFLGSAQQLNHVFTAPGTYTVMYEYDEPYEVCVPDPEQPGSGVMICHTEYNSGSATKTVTVTDSPIQPVVQSNASVICSPAAINFTVTNPSAGVTYSWSSVPAGYSGSGTQVTFDHVAQTTEFVVTATKGACSLQTSNTIILDQTLAQPILDPTNQYRKRILNATAYPPDHYWQASAQGQDISNNLVAGFAVTESGSYFVRKYSEQGSCWTSASGAVNVVVNYQPPLAIFSEVKKSGYSIFYFRNNDKAYIFQFADYYWVNGPSDAPEIIRPYNDVQSLIGDKIFSDGTYYLKGRDRATNTWGPTLTLNVDIREDDDINWIHTKSFDGTIQGTGLTVVSESKAYFDEAGSSLQTQAKNFTKN